MTITMFPQRLDSSLAYATAKAAMDCFNRHQRLIPRESGRAKHRIEVADRHGQQRAQRERIALDDLRMKETPSASMQFQRSNLRRL